MFFQPSAWHAATEKLRRLAMFFGACLVGTRESSSPFATSRHSGAGSRLPVAADVTGDDRDRHARVSCW